ncbi:hypothetical protein OUZ56_031267 [Daphnia magna]|uniref:Uncharacterized protein n=1 Tax=Daphnia magna TaxID=35525 RepID=A0ABQ9ZTS6_9CRUS|nr:hypothetical protein OUZ56_031267 [Daphnia magna]
MAEGGNNDPADLDAVSIQSDASTEILYIPEGQVVPVVDLITPSTTPDSSVHFVSPSGSSCSDLIDSDGESICDPPMLDESDYSMSIPSPWNSSEEDQISSYSGSFTGSELSLESSAVSEDLLFCCSESSLCSDDS